MKHLFSILFSLLVFLSGMHISLATHYCQGKIAATKFSISGEKASCGMEKCKTNFPVTGNQIASNCCRDEIAVYATDNNYTPEVTQITKTAENIAQIFQIPSKHILARFDIPLSAPADIGPPGHHFIAAMSLPGICAFRI